MKIGKGPKRFGGPSEKFLMRKRGLDPNGRPATGGVMPKEGPVRIFLDDERALPFGWTLARGPKEFFDLVDGLAPGRLVGLSLDWHLGAEVVNGEEIARTLVRRMKEKPETFSNLEIIRLHSSDRVKAIAMMRTVEEPLREDWPGLPFYSTDLGLPDMHGRADIRAAARRHWHDRERLA